VVNEV
jgi:hypothetical protein